MAANKHNIMEIAKKDSICVPDQGDVKSFAIEQLLRMLQQFF